METLSSLNLELGLILNEHNYVIKILLLSASLRIFLIRKIVPF
jgi:hypothetical protein